MINVVFEKKNQNLISFKIEGHAGFDEYGKDIVCSAISAISQTTLIGILDVLKINVDYDIVDGFLSLRLEKKTIQEIEKCQVLLQTMLLGFKSIRQGYKNYINVIVEEV